MHASRICDRRTRRSLTALRPGHVLARLRTGTADSIRGFTLIELLTVIAIIGVLAAVLIPTVSKVRETARRTVDASNLREIAKAAMIYAAENQDRLPDPLSATAQSSVAADNDYFRWIGLLGRSGALNNPSLYFSAGDPLFDGDLPPTVMDPEDPDRKQVSAALQAKTPSYEFVGGLTMSDPPTTPLAFTRGLTAGGTWDSQQGVYHDEGGHVVFLDGHVQFFRSIDNRLVNTRGRATSNLLETVPAPEGGNQRVYGRGSVIASEDGVAPVVPTE